MLNDDAMEVEMAELRAQLFPPKEVEHRKTPEEWEREVEMMKAEKESRFAWDQSSVKVYHRPAEKKRVPRAWFKPFYNLYLMARRAK